MSGEAVFFIPHQDDEILTQGAYIQQHVAAGRDVKIVLLTDGQSSGARALIETQKGIALSQSAFSKARDREFLDCLGRLGIPPSSVFFENREDSQVLTRNIAKDIFRKYVEKFPNGSYKTMSWMDAHTDHFAMGRALDEMNRAGEIPNGDARFCRSTAYLDAPTPGGSKQRGDDSVVINAANAYNVWEPDNYANGGDMMSGPRYAVGFTSVKSDFNRLIADPYTFVHADSSGYTASQRTAANNWLANNGRPAYL
jgi:LmbE family N-acetylglucosaminyl deacetylase